MLLRTRRAKSSAGTGSLGRPKLRAAKVKSVVVTAKATPEPAVASVMCRCGSDPGVLEPTSKPRGMVALTKPRARPATKATDAFPLLHSQPTARGIAGLGYQVSLFQIHATPAKASQYIEPNTRPASKEGPNLAPLARSLPVTRQAITAEARRGPVRDRTKRLLKVGPELLAAATAVAAKAAKIGGSPASPIIHSSGVR